MASEEETRKLNDEEKFKLIEFYKENPELWVTNQGVNRAQRTLKKNELIEHFGEGFGIELLENVFMDCEQVFSESIKNIKREMYLKKGGNFMTACYFLKKSEQSQAKKLSLQPMNERLR